MAEAPGTDIGPYRIVAPIGSGGFATVYLARDHRLDCDVAIKILAENHSLDPEVRERFLVEAQLQRRVDSPHVLRVLDLGETRRLQPFLVLELADRGALEQRVEQLRRDPSWHPSPEDVLALARGLAAGLAAVHSLGLVHRDVSPGNLLLRGTSSRLRDAGHRSAADGDATAGRLVEEGERVVLADLGHAKDLLAHSGMTVGGGTPRFAAPEQQRGIGRIDERADVYSASAVLAWLVAEDGVASTATRPPGEAPERASASVALVRALERGMAAEPGGRPATMGDWLDSIESALAPPSDPPELAGPGSAERDPAGPESGNSRNGGARRLALGAAAVAVASAILTAGVAYALSQRSGLDESALDDGRIRVSTSEGSLSAALFVPGEPVAGQEALLEAGGRGVVDYVWVLPDGSLEEGRDSVVFELVEGPNPVRLIVTGEQGATVQIPWTLEAQAAESAESRGPGATFSVPATTHSV